VREALTGLTTRGRSFLAAGAAAIACALLLGQPELLRVGVLVVSLPLLSAFAVWRTQYRLAGSRRLSPSRVPVGGEVTVTLSLENVSRLPTGVLLLEDAVPYALGSRPRFVLARVEPRGRREVSYRVRSDVRGRFRLGPLSLRLADPFGLCELSRSFTSRDALTVTPPVRELPTLPLGGEWSGSGESHAKSVTAAGEDDVATREYRHGDDLRRVHWRSTARHGELMVRREEQPWQSRATLLLDTRAHAHRGQGGASSFEWAVNAAASIGVHLSRRGYSVRLVTGGGGVSAAAHESSRVGGDFEGVLLDALAVVGTSRDRSVAPVTADLRRGADDLLVAVVGLLTAQEAEELAQRRHGATSAIAILLDVPEWGHGPGARGVRREDRPGQNRRGGPRQPQDGAEAMLRRAGWRVVRARSGDQLATLWRQVGHGAPLAGDWRGEAGDRAASGTGAGRSGG
jgi:uncharacterized protein (DUF58 family)